MSSSLVEVFPKSRSLTCMLCSSSTGLDDVLNCNAAIVTSESRAISEVFCCGSCGGVVVKMNPDQLLTHWLLRLLCAVTSAETRWRPLTVCGTRGDQSRSFRRRILLLGWPKSTTAWVETTAQDWCRGGVLLPLGRSKCLADIRLYRKATSVNALTSL